MSEITTPEALDALPVGSVVLDGMGDAWQRSDADTDWWAPANPFYAEADAANVLEQGGTEHPATLLYRPDRPSDLAALRTGNTRERVAAALYDGNEAFHAALAHERGREYQRIERPPWADTDEYYRALYRARADAALAALGINPEDGAR